MDYIAATGGFVWPDLPQQIANGILLGAIYSLIALGYTMVYGVLRLINFAHGEVFMLGAYIALFVSWAFGFSPAGLANNPDPKSSVFVLGVMLIASMVGCALIGVLIERFAYRPMRNQPRIASLITAIGISLLIQFGGTFVLPVSPQPNINETVNPFSGTQQITFKPAPAALYALEKTKTAELVQATKEFNAVFEKEKKERKIASKFQLSPEGAAIRDRQANVEKELNDARGKISQQSIGISLPNGQLIMFGTSIGLMLILRQMVMKTRTGRAMRAASHDFDSAQLMGINVNTVVTVTFVIGSALAGAGAMMNATFLSTPLTTFYGVNPGVKAFVAAVLGGIGNIPGAVLGGILMGLSEALVAWAGYGPYKDAVAFVILIVVLLFRPGGLLGSSKVEKV